MNPSVDKAGCAAASIWRELEICSRLTCSTTLGLVTYERRDGQDRARRPHRSRWRRRCRWPRRGRGWRLVRMQEVAEVGDQRFGGPSTELADLGIRHPPKKHFPRWWLEFPTALTREFLSEDLVLDLVGSRPDSPQPPVGTAPMISATDTPGPGSDPVNARWSRNLDGRCRRTAYPFDVCARKYL
jgi:hypothetical protein